MKVAFLSGNNWQGQMGLSLLACKGVAEESCKGVRELQMGDEQDKALTLFLPGLFNALATLIWERRKS